MKNIFIVLLLITCISVVAQKVNVDSLKAKIDDYQSKFNVINNKLEKTDNDLLKLKKIKFSGYIQAQWEFYDKSPKVISNNTFYLRRTRLKTTYEATDGIKFVLQPDFTTGNLFLKDAYVVLNESKFKIFNLHLGQFDRLNYEVELSSASLDVMERSRIIRAIYPKESDVGAKLEIKPKNIPLVMKIALFNGNFFTANEQKDNDNGKDLMARFVYSLKFPDKKLGIDFGVHGYYGSIKTTYISKYILNSDNTLDSVSKIGDLLYKKWIGAEARFYSDFLGGLAIKAEYIAGQFATLGTYSTTSGLSTSFYPTFNNGTITYNGLTTTTKAVFTPNKLRNFSGYYIYLIKNINKKNQLVLKFDNYDPNTKLSRDNAGKDDIYYNTFTFAWQYLFDDNIKITLGYEMPLNEHNSSTKSNEIKNFYGKQDILDNTITVRVQARF